MAITMTHCAPSRSSSPTWTMPSSRRRLVSPQPFTPAAGALNRSAELLQLVAPEPSRRCRGGGARRTHRDRRPGRPPTECSPRVVSTRRPRHRTAGGWPPQDWSRVSTATASRAWRRCCKPSARWPPSGATASCSTPPPRWRHCWHCTSVSSIWPSPSCSARSVPISAVRCFVGATRSFAPGLPWRAATWPRRLRRWSPPANLRPTTPETSISCMQSAWVSRDARATPAPSPTPGLRRVRRWPACPSTCSICCRWANCSSARRNCGTSTGWHHNCRKPKSVLARLGQPALWSAAFHWCGVLAAIVSDRPEALIPHADAISEACHKSAVTPRRWPQQATRGFGCWDATSTLQPSITRSRA